jgi:hypothetical protein
MDPWGRVLACVIAGMGEADVGLQEVRASVESDSTDAAEVSCVQSAEVLATESEECEWSF